MPQLRSKSVAQRYIWYQSFDLMVDLPTEPVGDGGATNLELLQSFMEISTMRMENIEILVRDIQRREESRALGHSNMATVHGSPYMESGQSSVAGAQRQSSTPLTPSHPSSMAQNLYNVNQGLVLAFPHSIVPRFGSAPNLSETFSFAPINPIFS
ncbi:hypothetical protein K7X08_024613 [Anisodus acutangulus]|uniref:Uncharacterized protein n=1 Tax=Anisodus acutangulus TaxID=402998 RepID=A0A9Q1M859_9SOLA|nr:hypothetical protein K7X08_024613 [Anisodus acutangulus]